MTPPIALFLSPQLTVVAGPVLPGEHIVRVAGAVASLDVGMTFLLPHGYRDVDPPRALTSPA